MFITSATINEHTTDNSITERDKSVKSATHTPTRLSTLSVDTVGQRFWRTHLTYSLKFKHNTSIGVAMKTFGTEFRNFTVRGRVSKKRKNFSKIFNFLRVATSGRHNSAMITDHQKITTKIALYRISSFHFHRWNQFKVIPLAWTLRTRNLPKFSATSDAGWQQSR